MLGDVVKGADVGMVERGDGARFQTEAADGSGVGGDSAGEKLEGDGTLQARVLRPDRLRRCRPRRVYR